ncbi:MAG: hypothetical protein K2K08_07445 [Paramuribaculum sp.]|nr:hypothetical protein [Paramuribaculum sp.]
MKIRLIIALILFTISQTHVAQGQETSTQTTQTQKLYQLSTPVKVIHEWEIQTDILADNPQFNTTDYKVINKAIENGDLDEMSTRVVNYEFTSDGKVLDWVLQYNGQTPVKVRVCGLPGIFNVDFENGRPVKFTLDKDAFQNDIDEGKIYLDGYEKGLEYFDVSYNNQGFPSSLSGKSLDYFGGNQYQESYSKYTIDSNGNWINRIVDTPNETKKQYRSYEY